MKYPKQLRSRGKKLESNIVFIKYFARFTTNTTGNNGTTNTTTNNNNDNNNNIITYNIRSFLFKGCRFSEGANQAMGKAMEKFVPMGQLFRVGSRRVCLFPIGLLRGAGRRV